MRKNACMVQIEKDPWLRQAKEDLMHNVEQLPEIDNKNRLWYSQLLDMNQKFPDGPQAENLQVDGKRCLPTGILSFKLDWLHIVGLGVAAGCLGNIFWQAQARMQGNLQQRLQHLFLEMRTYYAATDWPP